MIAYRIDSVLDSVYDIMNVSYKAAMAPNDETKKAQMLAYYEGPFTKWITAIDKIINENTN